MSTTTVDRTFTRIDVRYTAGDHLTWGVDLADAGGPLDLTGYTVEADAARHPSSAERIPIDTVVDGSRLTFLLATGRLAGPYAWRCRLTSPSGHPHTPCGGQLLPAEVIR